MAIELFSEIISKTDLIGDDNFDMTAGQELKIEKPGEDILKAAVPAGKKWHVHVAVVIQEVDA